MQRWADSFERVPPLLADHVQLSFSALLLGLAIALPLSVWAARNRTVARAALGFASLIQTIPSLALLALFFPLLLALTNLVGDVISPLGFLPSLLALTLYALLPILRNAVTGLNGVEPALIEAADGVGMTSMQKLRLVEAPLAAPTIMAGIRTAAVWTIGAATLSTTVGQSSLGDLIFSGLQTQNWTLVLAGCVASAALALSVDALLGVIESAIAERAKRRRGYVAGGLLGVLLLAALAPALAPERDAITIGAKRFNEQYILARLMGERLRGAGYAVRYQENLGSAVMYQAVANGDVDISIDYTGTIWTNYMKREEQVDRDTMYAEIEKWAREKHGMLLLGRLGFENTYAFAVRAEDAKKYNLESLEDLVRVAPDFKMGTDVEFLERPEWAAVKRAYPLDFKSTQGYEPTFMYRALASGEVDVITAFSSDGRIAANGFVTLSDPKGAIPNYDAVIMVSPDKADDARFLDALRPLVGAITVEDMRAANYRVDRPSDQQSPREAAEWLDGRIRGEK